MSLPNLTFQLTLVRNFAADNAAEIFDDALRLLNDLSHRKVKSMAYIPKELNFSLLAAEPTDGADIGNECDDIFKHLSTPTKPEGEKIDMYVCVIRRLSFHR